MKMASGRKRRKQRLSGGEKQANLLDFMRATSRETLESGTTFHTRKPLLSLVRSNCFSLDLYVAVVCTTCGSPHVVKAGNRKNKRGKTQRYRCKNCDEYFVNDFNKYGHLPGWVYDRVLFSVSKGDRYDKIVKEVEREGGIRGEEIKISIPSIYSVIWKCSRLLDEFETIALRRLAASAKTRGEWQIDERWHALPRKKRSKTNQPLLSAQTDSMLKNKEGRRKRRRRKKKGRFMYVTAVVEKDTGYCSCTVASKKRDLAVALRALYLASKRAGYGPKRVESDGHGPYAEAARILFPTAEIVATSKKENFTCIQNIENWFSGASRAIPKHGHRFRLPKTLELAYNIYRHCRNFLEPYRETGKTPAEMRGIVLPSQVKSSGSWLKLLEFAHRVVRLTQSEEKRDSEFRNSAFRFACRLKDKVNPRAFIS